MPSPSYHPAATAKDRQQATNTPTASLSRHRPAALAYARARTIL